MAARTGKYVKRSETLMKANKFDDKDQNTALSILVLFKRACDFNEFSEGMSLW